jgi:polyisoprenoid-binding protein YceI
MKRIYPILIVLFAGAVISALAALYVLRPPAEASGPIEAVPLGVVATESVEAATDVIETAQETAVDTVPETVTGDASAAAETEAAPPIEEAEEAAVTEQLAAETVDSGGLIIYQISSADSQVRFELDEDLRGNRVTVVGTTNQVAGELAVALNDLSQTQVGVIQINARTLATDNGNRNRAMQNEILDTGSYEYITFVPTAVTGLPESVNIGDAITFTIEEGRI